MWQQRLSCSGTNPCPPAAPLSLRVDCVARRLPCLPHPPSASPTPPLRPTSVLRFWILRFWLEQSLNVKGWNSQANREFTRNLESTNLSREILSRQIGHTSALLGVLRLSLCIHLWPHFLLSSSPPLPLFNSPLLLVLLRHARARTHARARMRKRVRTSANLRVCDCPTFCVVCCCYVLMLIAVYVA